jgi:hypothetical protein
LGNPCAAGPLRLIEKFRRYFCCNLARYRHTTSLRYSRPVLNMVDREFQGTDPQSRNPKARIDAQGISPISTLRFRLRNPRSVAVSLGSASFLDVVREQDMSEKRLAANCRNVKSTRLSRQYKFL